MALSKITSVSIDNTLPISATTIGVGGATPSTSGAGITFPATQSVSTNANTLDDYEEGTWTPVITGSGGNPTITGAAHEAQYTKIGNFVTLNFYLQGASSGGSGDLAITGIPYDIAAPNCTSGSVLTYNCSFSGNAIVWRASGNTLKILGGANNGSSWSFQPVGGLSSGLFAITGTFTYQTA